MSLPQVTFQRTACPLCGSTSNQVTHSNRVGAFAVRYHACGCQQWATTFRSLDKIEVTPAKVAGRRKSRIPRR